MAVLLHHHVDVFLWIEKCEVEIEDSIEMATHDEFSSSGRSVR